MSKLFSFPLRIGTDHKSTVGLTVKNQNVLIEHLRSSNISTLLPYVDANVPSCQVQPQRGLLNQTLLNGAH